MKELSLYKKRGIYSKNFLQTVLPVLFGVIVLMMLTYYKIKFGIRLMESDSASDILYAYLLSNENKFLLNNWYFSTELRIFDNELLFAILFRLFPQLDWWIVETIGTAIMNGIMGLASVLVAYKLQLGYKSLWMFGFTLLPYGISEYYYVLMHGCGYYSFAIIELYITLALFLTITNSKHKSQFIVSYVCYLGLSLLIGIQGVRLLANLYSPLLISGLIIFIYNNFYLSENNFTIKNIISNIKKDRLILASFSGTCMAVIGYATNFLILAKNYTWRQSNNLQWKEFSIEPIIAFVNDIISNWGYIGGGYLLSFSGFANLISLVISILVLFSLVSMCTKAEIFRKDRFIIIFFVIAFFIHLFIYIFLQKEYKARYMLPFFMLFPHVFILSIKEWQSSIRKIAISIFICCSIITSINVVYYWHLKGNHQNINVSEQKQMVEFLLNNNYEYGFATFWYCNSAIQLSNGRLDICPLQSINILKKQKWLCTNEDINYDWSDKIFLIVSNEQLKNEGIEWTQKSKLIWHSEGIYVFGYNSITELQNIMVE